MPNQTLIFAHRGSKCNRPENTLPAFEEAVRAAADGIELDVHLTKDQKLVVIHDEKVNRTTNGRGNVRDYDLAQLKALDAGSWFSRDFENTKIPLLSEVLEALLEWDFTGQLNIEVKTDKFHYPNIEKFLLELISKQEWPFKIIYSSFNFKSLILLHQLDSSLELAALVKNNLFKIQEAQKAAFISALHPRGNYFLSHQEKFNKACRLWTVNEDSAIKQAFESNVAAIFTDFPEKAVKIRKKMKDFDC